MFKTEGEMALYCLAYNMRRAMNMRTMGELVAGMTVWWGELVRGDFQGTVLVAERRGDLGDAVQ